MIEFLIQFLKYLLKVAVTGILFGSAAKLTDILWKL